MGMIIQRATNILEGSNNTPSKFKERIERLLYFLYKKKTDNYEIKDDSKTYSSHITSLKIASKECQKIELKSPDDLLKNCIFSGTEKLNNCPILIPNNKKNLFSEDNSPVTDFFISEFFFIVKIGKEKDILYTAESSESGYSYEKDGKDSKIVSGYYLVNNKAKAIACNKIFVKGGRSTEKEQGEIRDIFIQFNIASKKLASNPLLDDTTEIDKYIKDNNEKIKTIIEENNKNEDKKNQINPKLLPEYEEFCGEYKTNKKNLQELLDKNAVENLKDFKNPADVKKTFQQGFKKKRDLEMKIAKYQKNILNLIKETDDIKKYKENLTKIIEKKSSVFFTLTKPVQMDISEDKLDVPVYGVFQVSKLKSIRNKITEFSGGKEIKGLASTKADIVFLTKTDKETFEIGGGYSHKHTIGKFQNYAGGRNFIKKGDDNNEYNKFITFCDMILQKCMVDVIKNLDNKEKYKQSTYNQELNQKLKKEISTKITAQKKFIIELNNELQNIKTESDKSILVLHNNTSVINIKKIEDNREKELKNLETESNQKNNELKLAQFKIDTFKILLKKLGDCNNEVPVSKDSNLPFNFSKLFNDFSSTYNIKTSTALNKTFFPEDKDVNNIKFKKVKTEFYKKIKRIFKIAMICQSDENFKKAIFGTNTDYLKVDKIVFGGGELNKPVDTEGNVDTNKPYFLQYDNEITYNKKGGEFSLLKTGQKSNPNEPFYQVHIQEESPRYTLAPRSAVNSYYEIENIDGNTFIKILAFLENASKQSTNILKTALTITKEDNIEELIQQALDKLSEKSRDKKMSKSISDTNTALRNLYKTEDKLLTQISKEINKQQKKIIIINKIKSINLK